MDNSPNEKRARNGETYKKGHEESEILLFVSRPIV